MADEDVYPASLLNAWRSARLVYRAVEEDEDDKAFICEVMGGDPVAVAMGSFRKLSPGDRVTGQRFYELTKHNPLRVLICLPAAAENTGEKKEPGGDENNTDKDKNKKPQNPTPIGMVSLFWTKGPDFQHNRDVNLGISLVKGYRGKGYGAEAINWALDWGFRWGGFHRIGLTAFSYNPRAIRLYRSLGFVEEGRIRESLYHDRKRHDEVFFGMLASEWEKLRGLSNGGGEGEMKGNGKEEDLI